MTYSRLSLSAARFALGIAALGVTACGDASTATGKGGTGGTSSGSAGTNSSGGTTPGSGGSGFVSSGGSGPSTGGGAGTIGSGGNSGGNVGSGGDGSGGLGQGGSQVGGSSGSGSGGSPPTGDNPNSGPDTMGWIGCSMGENTASGYRAIGGTRMWGPYGNGGAVVGDWLDPGSQGWDRFDNQVAQHGSPAAVWIMLCIFALSPVTIEQARTLVDNARMHAPGAYIYITGQPTYEPGHVCTLAGDGGPELTDSVAQQVAAEDPDVHYPGELGPLSAGEWTNDSCHANSEGEQTLGTEVKGWWGQP
jgi:hypothetical protein